MSHCNFLLNFIVHTWNCKILNIILRDCEDPPKATSSSIAHTWEIFFFVEGKNFLMKCILRQVEGRRRNKLMVFGERKNSSIYICLCVDEEVEECKIFSRIHNSLLTPDHLLKNFFTVVTLTDRLAWVGSLAHSVPMVVFWTKRT